MLYRKSPARLSSSVASVEVRLSFIVSLLWENLESSCAAAWAPLSGYLGCRTLSSSPLPRPPPLKEAVLCARRVIYGQKYPYESRIGVAVRAARDLLDSIVGTVELDEAIDNYLRAS